MLRHKANSAMLTLAAQKDGMRSITNYRAICMIRLAPTFFSISLVSHEH